VVEHELEHTAAVDRVLRAIREASRPDLPLMPEFVWRALRVPSRRALYVCGAGLLPPALRERLGIRFTKRDETELRLIGAASRSLTPVLPRPLKVSGPAQLRWRRRAIARGPLGPPAGHGTRAVDIVGAA
jgi:uncharacterized protein (DUF2236 family)